MMLFVEKNKIKVNYVSLNEIERKVKSKKYKFFSLV
jgi:hypothetical protein